MRFKVALVFVALMIVLTSLRTRAHYTLQDSGPSLQETIEWLKAKLSENGSLGYFIQSKARTSDGELAQIEIRHNLNYSSLNFNQCGLTWTETHTLEGYRRNAEIGNVVKRWNDKKTLDYSLSFSDIDPSGVKVGEYLQDTPSGYESHGYTEGPLLPLWEVLIATKNNKESITVQTGDQKKLSTTARFVFRDRELAKRISSAFKHEAELCNSNQQ